MIAHPPTHTLKLFPKAMTSIALVTVVTFLCLLTPRYGFADERFRLVQLAANRGVIWGMDVLAEDKLIFTEKSGSVSILETATGEIYELPGAPEVIASGQGGLLDVAVSPDFETTGEIFFTYSKRVNRHGVTTLARARLAENMLVAWQDILVTDSLTDTHRHYGSRITFDDAGHIFFTVGDRGERPNAQNLSNHAGSVLRLNLDGTTPKDNPFIGTPGAQPEIYSYGHRNPQGITFDTSTGRLWLIEHGPRGGDEINLIDAGKNYGWPVVSHGKEYYAPIPVGEATEKPGFQSPLKVYTPSIAPGSLILYSGKAFPQWRGNLFAGALKLRHLNRVTIDALGRPISEERLFQSLNERIRAITECEYGKIYFSTDSGKIFQITPR